MQQTENYQLSLWNREDRILMGILREEDEAASPAAASPLREAAPAPGDLSGTA